MIIRAPFLIAIVLAAFLLFTLELLAGRLVLPVFGGAPAVWTTALCFFTAILFVGYVYAHLAASRLSIRSGGLVQVTLAVATIVSILVAPADVASLKMPGVPAALNVLVALTVISGPAAFLLASTTPLLSSWYARARLDPWWLYAASNAASFAALLAYPFVIGPLIPLSIQRWLLAAALVVYAATLGWSVARARSGSSAPQQATVGAPETLRYRRQAIWLLAAAVPAGLLSAATNFIQTDLIAAPLIWIGPLGVYLASFVVAFSERGRRVLPSIERLVPPAATLLWIPFAQPGWPVPPLLVTVLAAYFVLAVAIHGRLAADRPAESGLTRFYLVIALGGLLATAFVALVAPSIFSLIYEYPLLIVAGLVVLVLLPGPALPPGLRVVDDPRGALVQLAWRLLPFGAAGVLLYVLIPSDQPAIAARLAKLLLLGAALVAISVTARVNAVVTPVALALVIALNVTSPLFRERSFFGITEVVASGNVHAEYSGLTLHGLQFTDQRSGEPTTYFAKAGPLGAVFDDLRARTAGAAIGVVGLGIGTIAAYAQPGDWLTFYEIDTTVIDVARNPRYFTYLQNAAVPARIVPGDGRLSLDGEAQGVFDLLVLDAFTSDVVPAHLLTREAMTRYMGTLRPGGLLAFHLSSRFYNLAGAVGATARSVGLAAAGHATVPDRAAMDQTGASSSLWVVVGETSGVARFIAHGWVSVPLGGPVLTDDYSDLTRLLDAGGG